MTNTFHHGDKAKIRKFGLRWWWYKSTPKWWNKIYHTKRRRAENRRLEKKVARGEYEQVWPLGNRRPHEPYW